MSLTSRACIGKEVALSGSTPCGASVKVIRKCPRRQMTLLKLTWLLRRRQTPPGSLTWKASPIYLEVRRKRCNIDKENGGASNLNCAFHLEEQPIKTKLVQNQKAGQIFDKFWETESSECCGQLAMKPSRDSRTCKALDTNSWEEKQWSPGVAGPACFFLLWIDGLSSESPKQHQRILLHSQGLKRWTTLPLCICT